MIAFRGCLEARSDRALRNYDSDVATIMQQSEQSGKDFFNLLNGSSGASSSLDAQQEVLRQRDTSQTLLDRADDLSAPGQMHDAQNAVIQTLTLRRDALSSIAQNVTQATARTQTGNAITAISNAMGSLYASDILWTQIGKPEIEKVAEGRGRRRDAAAQREVHARERDRLSEPDDAGHQAQRDHRADRDHRGRPRPAARLDLDRGHDADAGLDQQRARATPRRSTSR